MTLLSRAAGGAAAAALGLLAASPARALALYDDFSSVAISPYRWQGTQTDDGAAVILDARRTLVSGALRLESKAYGDNSSNVLNAHAAFGVRFARSPDISDIKVTVTPRSLTTADCPANTSWGPATVGFQVGGGFFNSSTGSAPSSSHVYDVRAYVQILRAPTDAAGVATVTGSVMRCMDELCRRGMLSTPVSMGTVALNVATTVEIQWDRGNHRFVFRRDAQAAQTIDYAYPDTVAAHDTSKVLEVVGNPLTCSTGRLATYGGADFDDVYTNTLP